MRTVPLEQLEEVVQTEALARLKYGSIGGVDCQITWGQFHQSCFDMAGLSAAWRLSSNIYALSAIQRPGRTYIDRGGFNFYKIRDEKGLKEAIRERDKPFEPYSPIQRSKAG